MRRESDTRRPKRIGTKTLGAITSSQQSECPMAPAPGRHILPHGMIVRGTSSGASRCSVPPPARRRPGVREQVTRVAIRRRSVRRHAKYHILRGEVSP